MSTQITALMELNECMAEYAFAVALHVNNPDYWGVIAHMEARRRVCMDAVLVAAGVEPIG